MRGRHPAQLLRALALGACLAPGAAEGETLSDALVSAYLSSPELRAQVLTVRVLGEQAYQARAAGRLQAQGVVSITSVLDGYERPRLSVELFANIVQPLYTGGQVENATEAAEARIGAGKAQTVGAARDVLLGAVVAYVDVRRDLVLIAQAGSTIRALAELMRQVRDRVELGVAQRVDLAQAEARLAAARGALAEREGELARSRERYRRVVGAYPGELAPPPPLPDLPDTLDQAVEIALVRDSDVRAARLERLATGLEVRAAIGALLPQVALESRLGRFDPLGLGDENLNAVLGLRLAIPFYDGGFTYSRVREAQAEVERATAGIDEALRNAVQRTGRAWADVAAARASAAAGEVEVVAAELAYRGVRDEVEIGVRTVADVLDAEQELLDARGALAEARRDEYAAAYTLLAEIGMMTVEHLGLDLPTPAAAMDDDAAIRDRLFGFDPSDDTAWTLSYRP